MKLLGLGDTFEGGKVVRIEKYGVMTEHNNFKRMYPLKYVEQEVLKSEDATK